MTLLEKSILLPAFLLVNYKMIIDLFDTVEKYHMVSAWLCTGMGIIIGITIAYKKEPTNET